MDDHQLAQIFLKEINKFDRYVLTFVLLAILWIGHHQQFHYIKRTDRRFLWIQVAILMFIVMVPFTAAWMSAYSHLHITNFVFDLNLFILGLLFLISWLYAVHDRKLVEENIEHAFIRAGIWRSVISCIVALVAMALSFYHPGWSNYAFILIPILTFAAPFKKRRARTNR